MIQCKPVCLCVICLFIYRTQCQPMKKRDKRRFPELQISQSEETKYSTSQSNEAQSQISQSNEAQSQISHSEEEINEASLEEILLKTASTNNHKLKHELNKLGRKFLLLSLNANASRQNGRVKHSNKAVGGFGRIGSDLLRSVRTDKSKRTPFGQLGDDLL